MSIFTLFMAGLLSQLCLYLYAASGEKSSSAATLQLRWIERANERKAVCNDGSPGAFYHTPASDPSMKNTFLILLPGGGQCYDQVSCADRWKDAGPTLMSSKGFTRSKTKDGLFDTDPSKTPFWAANKILLGYCSSDGYMGNVSASEETWGWHFRGQAVVTAMIEDVISLYNINSQSRIIMAGGSAGARGVMTLVDRLVEEYFPVGAKIFAFLDSPYYLDVVPYSSSFEGFQYQEQQKYHYYNTAGALSSSCNATYGSGSTDSLWKCQYGQYRMPFINTPFFLIASQYDSYQLSENTQTDPPYFSNNLVKYTNDFASLTRNGLHALMNPVNRSTATVNAIFSWTCYNHDISETSDFSRTRNNQHMSENDALREYLKLDPFMIIPPRQIKISSKQKLAKSSFFLHWIDDCGSMSCGGGCFL